MSYKVNLEFHSYDIASHTGYGKAAQGLYRALWDQDVDMPEASRNILNFCKAEHYRFKDTTIGYTPWESTRVPQSWIEPMRQVDDLWTTSGWNADLFREVSGKDDIFIVPHGIDTDIWKPIKHCYQRHRPFTFVHVGEPAIRKGGDILLKAWHKHFRYMKDVQLIFKATDGTMCRIKDRGGSIVGYPGYENTQLIDKVTSDLELWQLYALSDVMVYPSRGEGFGFIPLEAMCTGLPTILPQKGMGGFSRYGNLLNESKLVPSTHQGIHPGDWYEHDIDELIAKMEEIMQDYNYFARQAYDNTNILHRLYNWNFIGTSILSRLKYVIN